MGGGFLASWFCFLSKWQEKEWDFFTKHLHLTPDNQDSMTRMFFHILTVFAEFERDLLKQRLAMERDIAREA